MKKKSTKAYYFSNYQAKKLQKTYLNESYTNNIFDNLASTHMQQQLCKIRFKACAIIIDEIAAEQFAFLNLQSLHFREDYSERKLGTPSDHNVFG